MASEETRQPSDDPQGSPEFEGLLAGYIEQFNRSGFVDPDQVNEENPRLSSALLEDLKTYVQLQRECKPEVPLGTLGDYTLRRQIGRGGMGVVYDAWQGSMDRRVALKVLPAGIAADDRAFQRFMQEARAAGKLNHPNIVAVHAMGQDANTPYYAMDFIEGETLAQILARLKEAEAEAETTFGKKDDVRYYANLADAFAAVADGLQHAHSKGVIHRDIKPSNLILDGESRLRILDFGLARLEGLESLTASGDFLGTPLYMSPEQARRKKVPVDHRTDIYSLGTTLYEMLTLEPPFRGKDHQDTLSQIIERDPVEPRKRNPRVPKDLNTIVLKCLRKGAGDRYGTAEAMGQDLRRFVRGEVIEAKGERRWERLARRGWRHRFRWALTGVSLGLVVTGGVLTWTIHEQRSAKRNAAYETLVLEAVENLPLERLAGIGDLGGLGEDQHEGQVLVESFRVLDEEHVRAAVERCVAWLRQAARILPRRPEAHYYLARALRLLGDETGSIAEIDCLHRNQPGFAPARTLEESTTVLAHEPGYSSAEAVGAGDPWTRAAKAAAARVWQEAALANGMILEESALRGEPFLGAALDAFIGRGIARLEAGSLEGAKRDFYAASLRWPRATLPALLLARAYLAERRPDDADDWLAERFRELDGSWQRDAFAMQAIQMLSAVDANESLLGWVDRLAPGRPRELARMHVLLWKDRLGEPSSAREVIRIGEELLRTRPEDALAHAFVALATSDVVGESHLHSEHLERALALAERDPQVLTLVARMVDPSKGIELCEKALAVDPGFLPARFLLADRHIDREEPEMAIEVLENRVARNREPARSFLSLGRARYLMQDIPGALECFREALRHRPGWSPALMNIASVHVWRGEQEEAEAAYRSIIAKDPNPWWQSLLGAVLIEDERWDDALELFCRALPRFPRVIDWAHWELEKILVLPDRLHSLRPLDGFVEAFAPRITEHGTSPWAHQSLSLGLIHAPRRKDLGRALELAARAVELTERKDARFLSTLAAAQHARGDYAVAVVTLEEASSRAFFDGFHAEQLAAYRRSLWPEVASMASVDVIAGQADARHRLGEARVPAAANAGEAFALISYLEASRLQAAGRSLEAVERLASLARGSVEPQRALARLVECLLAANRAGETATWLEEGIARGCADRGLWELYWTAVSGDLKARSGAADAWLPREPMEFATLPGHRDDMAWLIDRLRAGETLRIDCGLDVDHVDATAGTQWSRDRFYVGGWKETGESRMLDPLLMSRPDSADFYRRLSGAAYDRPYRAARNFPRLLPGEGYRIPLPAGRYRVALCFADLRYGHPGRRKFDVFLEDEKVLADYAPNAVGFATADIHPFTVKVEDGFLDLRFGAVIREPAISAIEIERVE